MILVWTVGDVLELAIIVIMVFTLAAILLRK